MRRRWLLLVFFLGLSACGFHFPGHDGAMPAALRRLQVGILGSAARNPPLLLALRRELAISGTEVVQGQRVGIPALMVTNEVFAPQVLAVDTTGRVSAYLLDYSLSFELLNGAGQVVLPMQSVRLQREYTFNIVNVLGEQRQQDYLQRRMRASAVRKLMFMLKAQGPAALQGAAAPKTHP